MYVHVFCYDGTNINSNEIMIIVDNNKSIVLSEKAYALPRLLLLCKGSLQEESLHVFAI